MAFQPGSGWPSAGWFDNNGVELYTLGWLRFVPIRPDCLPIIGYSWLADCPEQHYSLGWICCGIVIEKKEFGGRQFLIFQPITELVRQQLPVDEKVLPFLAGTETEFLIDGKKYELVVKRTPKEIINAVDNIDAILDKAVEKMGVTRRKAKKELYNQIIDALKEAESIKESLFDDDEEIIMILMATDDI